MSTDDASGDGGAARPDTGREVSVSRDVSVSRRRLSWVVVGIAALVFLADQGSKALAVRKLTGGQRVDVVGSLLGLRLTRNPGAAFSMATGATWLLTLVALVVVVVIIRISRRLGSVGWTIALGLLLGGALGNLTDRLTREPGFFRGHVIDFLVLPHWPVFNLADSSIVTAACLIALLSVIGIGIDGQRVAGDDRDVHDVPGDRGDGRSVADG
jgi:signal peptidase II